MEGWIKLHRCNRCNKKILDSSPRWEEKEICFCQDCAFIERKISDKEYLESCGISLDGIHAAVSPEGNIVVWAGKKTPIWERNNKDCRRSPQYEIWRKEVFARDNYTCQDCGTRGGNLEAHHIKTFLKYKKLRYAVSNGTTLCKLCHRNRHRKGGDANG